MKNNMLDSLDVAALIMKEVGYEGTTAKIHTLLYYVQGWSLAGLGRPAFAHDLQAWKHGPVSPPVWHAMESATPPEVTRTTASTDDKELLLLVKLVAPLYASKAASQLVAGTHNERPWVEARRGAAPGEHCSKLLDPHTMRDYFSNDVSAGGITPKDIALFGIESFFETDPTFELVTVSDNPAVTGSANLLRYRPRP